MKTNLDLLLPAGVEDYADGAHPVRAPICELRGAPAAPGGYQGHSGGHDQSEGTTHWRRRRR